MFNNVFNLARQERRIVALIKPEFFDKDDLIEVANLIKRRFPEPRDLNITFQTDLDRIETPEEFEAEHDSQDTRMSPFYGKYPEAYFSRTSRGRETLLYRFVNPHREVLVVVADTKPSN